VRDSTVYLRTVGGLQRVDVILRRVDDDYCDPLELYANSYLGVPGLLQSIREGNVTVTNALGAGVLQAAGFLPFLPSLCRCLLGEELKLSSVPTWWCGQPAELSFVLEHLHEMVIKSAYRRKERIRSSDKNLRAHSFPNWRHPSNPDPNDTSRKNL